jgi:hypothetical protein
MNKASEIEIKNFANYPKSGWLEEIFETVIHCIKPEFKGTRLVIVKNITEYLKKLPEFSTPKMADAGFSGLYKKTLGKDIEPPYWKGAIINNIAHIFVKPSKIISDQLTYEEVTAGFAHEISEAVIFRPLVNLWGRFSLEQISLLKAWHPEINTDGTLSLIAMNVRDRLADKYAAEKGFAREILSTITVNDVTYMNRVLHPIISKWPYPGVATFAVGLDKGLSLEGAGFSDISAAYLNAWEKGWRGLPQFSEAFFDYYKKFRRELLSLGLTSNSLLALFNLELLFEKSKTDFKKVA